MKKQKKYFVKKILRKGRQKEKKTIHRWLPVKFRRSEDLPLVMFGDEIKKKDGVSMKNSPLWHNQHFTQQTT